MTGPTPIRVFVAQPHRDGWLAHGAAAAFYQRPSLKYPVGVQAHGSSLLAWTFNRLWVEALEYRGRHAFTHFAMIHADVRPPRGWVDPLVDELLRLDADVVSAVVPIKDSHGLTSTAIGDPADEWTPLRRLLLREVHGGGLPETFDAADCGHPGCPLLVNTGLWVCDLRRPWADEFPGFTVRDRIVWTRRPDGTSAREAQVIPEDWGFSRWLWERGARVFATRTVSVSHQGAADYPSDAVWGDWEWDREYETEEQARGRHVAPQ